MITLKEQKQLRRIFSCFHVKICGEAAFAIISQEYILRIYSEASAFTALPDITASVIFISRHT